MPKEEITDEVKRFIQRTISSVEQLETLLFLMSNPTRGWTAEEVAERTRMPSDSAARRMRELARAQLVSQSGDDTPEFRYAPGSSALENELARSLEAAYRERRDSLIELIYSRPFDHIRVFADAFRIREDK